MVLTRFPIFRSSFFDVYTLFFSLRYSPFDLIQAFFDLNATSFLSWLTLDSLSTLMLASLLLDVIPLLLNECKTYELLLFVQLIHFIVATSNLCFIYNPVSIMAGAFRLDI